MAWSGFEKNYYGMLELSMEDFVSDIAILDQEYANHVRKWTSSKNSSIQKRPDTIGKDIQEAYHNPSEWKRLYSELKKEMDSTIKKSAEMSGGVLSDEEKIVASKNYRVSIKYIDNLIGVQGSASNSSSEHEDLRDIDTIKPSSTIENKLRQVNTNLQDLLCRNIADFIQKMTGAEIDINTCTAEDIIAPLTDLNNKWSVKPGAGADAAIKANVERIYTAMTDFFKSFSINDYRQYITYKEVKDILDKLRNAKTGDTAVLTDKLYSNEIDSICEFVSDKKLATAILRNFCKKNSISLPVKLPNSAVCPFCHTPFERKEPIQTQCPSCLASLIVTCPKCKKNKNLVVDSECDGIQLLQYPFLQKRLSEAEKFANSLAFTRALSIMSEIESEWPGFPGLDKTKANCEKIKKECGTDLAELQRKRSNGEYYAAKRICDKIDMSYPGFRKNNSDVYTKVDFCEQQLSEFRKEKDEDKKINILLGIVSDVADCSAAITELKKFPVNQPENIKVAADQPREVINLSWTSGNKPNSVDYVIIRQEGRPVSNYSDGVEVARTQSTSFNDSKVDDGKEYYYAVYACRGPIQSSLCVSDKASVILKKLDSVSTAALSNGVDISWRNCPGDISVFFDTKPLSRFREGNEVKNVTSSGFKLEGLTNGITYYFAAFHSLKIGGSYYCSEGVFFEVTPVEKMESPVITKFIGKEDGEYIISHTNAGQGNAVELYYSAPPAQITSNSNLSTAELMRKVKKLNVKIIDSSNFSVNVKNSSPIIVYPVVFSGATAFVGNFIELQYVEPLKVDNVIIGMDMDILLKEWPAGADTIYACYRHDDYPEDHKDGIRCIQIRKELYDEVKIIKIPGLDLREYYVSLFVRISGEYVPAYNYYFDNRKKTAIYYSFDKSVFRTVVKIDNNGNNSRPELILVFKTGGMPLNINDGESPIVIEAKNKPSKNELISITPPKKMKNCYGRLFCKDLSYDVLLKGSSKIN